MNNLSITFDPRALENQPHFFQKLNRSQPDDLAVLEYPPLSANAEILEAAGLTWFFETRFTSAK